MAKAQLFKLGLQGHSWLPTAVADVTVMMMAPGRRVEEVEQGSGQQLMGSDGSGNDSGSDDGSHDENSSGGDDSDGNSGHSSSSGSADAAAAQGQRHKGQGRGQPMEERQLFVGYATRLLPPGTECCWCYNSHSSDAGVCAEVASSSWDVASS